MIEIMYLITAIVHTVFGSPCATPLLHIEHSGNSILGECGVPFTTATLYSNGSAVANVAVNATGFYGFYAYGTPCWYVIDANQKSNTVC